MHIAFAARRGSRRSLASSAAAFSRREVAGRGLPDLARPAGRSSGHGMRRKARSGRAGTPLRVFSQGVVVQRPQPEDRAVLPGLPAPVRGSVAGRCLDRRSSCSAPRSSLSGCAPTASTRCSAARLATGCRRKVQGAGFRRDERYVPGGVYIALGAVPAVSGKDEGGDMNQGTFDRWVGSLQAGPGRRRTPRPRRTCSSKARPTRRRHSKSR